MGAPGHGVYNKGPMPSSVPPQLQTLPFQSSGSPPPQQPYGQQQVPASPYSPGPAGQLLPLQPVFGVSLEELFERDNSAVPMVVYQCIQAVDLFGLEVEGIYRLSGTASHITKLKGMFDNGKHAPESLEINEQNSNLLSQMHQDWTSATQRTSSMM